MGEKKQTPKTNSVVRALTVLKILQEKTDKDHALEQSAILDYIINDENCYSTDKTLNGDIKNLMMFFNPPSDQYNEQEEDFRIVYDRIGNGTKRITNLRYLHELSKDDLQALIDMTQASTEIGDEQKRRFIRFFEKQGSTYYKCHVNGVKGIPEYSTLNGEMLQQNKHVFQAAIENNHKVRFTLNVYNKEGKFVPCREKKYEVNPYYVVKYMGRYYLLATHKKYKDTHIYRMDLITDAEELEENRETIRGVDGLDNSNPTDYMAQHLDMFYDKPRTITIKLKNDSYTYLYDSFGTHYAWKRKVDEEYDEVEVIASEEAMINWALRHREDVEIVRPLPLRKRLCDEMQALLEKYRV